MKNKKKKKNTNLIILFYYFKTNQRNSIPRSTSFTVAHNIFISKSAVCSYIFD